MKSRAMVPKRPAETRTTIRLLCWWSGVPCTAAHPPRDCWAPEARLLALLEAPRRRPLLIAEASTGSSARRNLPLQVLLDPTKWKQYLNVSKTIEKKFQRV